MKRLSIDIDLTDGQYEVLQSVTAFKKEPIAEYVKDCTLSLLETDLEEIFGHGDGSPLKEERAKLKDPARRTQNLKKCIICREEGGTLVPYGNGIFTSTWMVHPRCKMAQPPHGLFGGQTS